MGAVGREDFALLGRRQPAPTPLGEESREHLTSALLGSSFQGIRSRGLGFRQLYYTLFVFLGNRSSCCPAPCRGLLAEAEE